jgi:U3 small nucleolar RNA-associated protein 22
VGACDFSCNPRTDKYTPRFSAAKEKKFGFSYSRPTLRIMATLPSKRRKLDHDRREDGFISENESGNTSSDDQSPSSLADEAPVALSKQTQTRPKQTLDADDNALYAGSLYKSSLFKLQIDELMAEVRPNYEKRLNGVDDTLRRLKSVIEAIDERDGLPVGFYVIQL